MNLLIYILTALLFFSPSLEARIRLRKVKEPPRTCTVMKEDGLLSRPEKLVWSTEKHSVVVSEQITLVNDLGIKICSWDKSLFETHGELKQFRFYIDEYKEMIHPFIDKKDPSGVIFLSTSFKECKLTNKQIQTKLELPKCEPPKKKKSVKKKKKKS